MFQAAGIQRKINGACRTCRATKSRCIRDRLDCLRCTQKGLQCVYDGLQRTTSRRTSSKLAVPSSSRGSYRTAHPTELDPIRLLSIPDDDHARSIGCLYTSSWPEYLGLIKRRTSAYFDRIHCLGCLGFIHGPTFMRSLDRGTFIHEFGEALINIVCALGAICLVAKGLRSSISTLNIQDLPCQFWAKRARSLAMNNLHVPSTCNLIALVLVCKYSLLMSEHAAVFTLVGCCYRLARLLKLDSEMSNQAVEEPHEYQSSGKSSTHCSSSI